ncbi:MAG TPA: SIS domain-containing protein [Terriglobales bacterium]|nr:SIS domain-containing protein [Terriglobales bacterium]
MKTADSLVKEQPVLKSSAYLAGARDVLARLDFDMVDRIAEQIFKAYKNNHNVFVFGNGGSAALASHFACDLAKGTATNGLPRLRAIALTDNIPMLTAWANDSGYEDIFAEQMLGHIQAGDVALAISGSGNSPNVIRGLEVARQAGATLIALTGYEGGAVKNLCDLCLVVPSDNMQHIEDAHLSVAHALFTATRHRILHSEGE